MDNWLDNFFFVITLHYITLLYITLYYFTFFLFCCCKFQIVLFIAWDFLKIQKPAYHLHALHTENWEIFEVGADQILNLDQIVHFDWNLNFQWYMEFTSHKRFHVTLYINQNFDFHPKLHSRIMYFLLNVWATERTFSI